MDFLRSLPGMLTSTVLRLVVVVGTLAAVYFFIVRPALDTTNNAINSINQNIGSQIQTSIQSSPQGIQRRVRRSLRHVPGLRAQKRLLHCIQRANGNVNRMQACSLRFSP